MEIIIKDHYLKLDLSYSQLIIYSYLCTHYSCTKEYKDGLYNLVNNLNISYRTVYRSLEQLVNLNLLTKVKVKGKHSYYKISNYVK